MISGDMDAAYEVAAAITEEEFAPVFEHYHARTKGTKSYELKAWLAGENSGGTTTCVAT